MMYDVASSTSVTTTALIAVVVLLVVILFIWALVVATSKSVTHCPGDNYEKTYQKRNIPESEDTSGALVKRQVPYSMGGQFYVPPIYPSLRPTFPIFNEERFDHMRPMNLGSGQRFNNAQSFSATPISPMSNIKVIRPTSLEVYPSATNTTVFRYRFIGGNGISRVEVHNGSGYVHLFTLEEKRSYRIYIGLTGQLFAIEIDKHSQNKTWIEFENPHRHAFKYTKTNPDGSKFEIMSPAGYFAMHQTQAILIEWDSRVSEPAYMEVYPDKNVLSADIWADSNRKILSDEKVQKRLALQVYYTIDVAGESYIFNTSDGAHHQPVKRHLNFYEINQKGALVSKYHDIVPGVTELTYITIDTPREVETDFDLTFPDLPGLPERDSSLSSDIQLTLRSITWQSARCDCGKYDPQGGNPITYLLSKEQWKYSSNICENMVIPWTRFDDAKFYHLYILRT